MDDPTLDEVSHRQALRGLARVNAISQTAQVIGETVIRQLGADPSQRLRLLDVACGGGDVTIGIARTDPLLEQSRRFEGLGRSLARRADLALARGDYATAIAAYRSFLVRREDMPTPYINLAQAYRLSGQFQEAITVYQQFEQRFGASQRAHVGLAQLYQQAGRRDLAIHHYQQALEFKPDDRQVLLALGMLQEHSGRVAKAISCYRRAVSADPRFFQAQLALGVALISQQEYEQAREHIRRAVALVPGDPIPDGYLRQLDELAPSVP